MKKSELKKIIREELQRLSEDEYDIWRDYKSGSLTKQEYEKALAAFKRRETKLTKHSYANYKDDLMVFGQMKIYFNIPFDKKDEFKKYYGSRWDSNKKKWYLILPKKSYNFKNFAFKDYYDKKETPAEFQKLIKL